MLRHPTHMRAAVLVAAFLVTLLAATTVQGYSVRYAGKTSQQPMMNFERVGYCGTGDNGHSMMPKLESYQTMAQQVLTSSSFSKAPIGGESRQAACLDPNCSWQFNHGLYYQNELTFYYGVVYKGTLRGGPAAGVYNNFASGQPQAWANVSYWGGRQPYMMTGGTWANDNVVTYYTQWVCEYYEFQRSDAALFPTYPDGIVIPPQSTSSYYHCGRLVERDSQGRWIYQRCKEPFPWWAALVIAVVGLIILVTIIIVICCCCFYCDRTKARKEREHKLETLADNPAQVPTQTQMGLSRAGSQYEAGEARSGSGDDECYSDAEDQ